MGFSHLIQNQVNTEGVRLKIIAKNKYLLFANIDTVHRFRVKTNSFVVTEYFKYFLQRALLSVSTEHAKSIF